MAREAALLAEPHAPQFLHAEGGTVTVPDAHLLFTADFHRSGHDLILTGDHGNSAVIADYFGDAGTPALVAPHGAMLTPEVVCALAGSAAPGQYAQTGASQAVAAIGKVAELTGTATAQRADGTIVDLHTGDALAAGDVLRTGADSKLSVLFIDGTIFNLTADARMVLNDLVYQEGGTSNSMTLSLVQGTFSFVAGQVAPTGEMRVDTPVATMGIRGTSGIMKVGTINGITVFRIVPDPLTNHVGAYVLISKSNPNLILATVDNPAFALLLDSPNGLPQLVPADTQSDQQIINDLVKAYQNFGQPQGPQQPEEPERHGSNEGGGSGGVTLMQVTPTAAEIAMFAALADSALDPLGETETLLETPLGETDTAPLTTTTLDTGTPPNQPNQPPPDNGPTTIGGETTGNVVDGQTDTTGGQLIVDSPGNGNAGVQPRDNVAGEFGTFSVDAAGNWTYVLNGNDPDVESLGEGVDATDSFVVTSADGTASQTIVVTVEGTNDDPVLTLDTSGSVQEDVGVVGGNVSDSGTLALTDVDVGDTHSVETAYNSDAVWSGGALTASQIAAITSGFTADANSWDFSTANSALQFLAAGETITLSFDVTVSDNHGGSDTETVTLTVTGSNEEASISGTSEGSVAEDGNDSASGTLTVDDPDHGEAAVQAFSGDGDHGTFSVDADGQWTYTLNNDDPAVQGLGAGETTTDSFTVTSADGTASKTVNITIEGKNDEPDITSAELTGSITEPQGSQSAPLTETAASYLVHGNTLVNGLGGAAGFGEAFLAANDDGTTGAIDLTAVFGSQGIDFFGTNYTTLYINNNGNVTFDSPLAEFTPTSITAGIGNPIIAPFWGDVDTRGEPTAATPGGTSTGSNLVWFDVDSTNSTLTVTWDDTAYFSQGGSANAFQLQLVSTGNGNFDIVFRYESINWTAGDASGGSGGLGGQTALAGYNAEDGIHTFEIPQSGDEGQMLGLPGAAGNTGINGVDVFHVIGGEVVPTTLTETGVITFTDKDINDIHSVPATGTYVGSGTALGVLTVHLDSDTTGTGLGGQLTWTYSVASAAINYLGEGETKIEKFDISIDDQHGGAITQTISVTLTGSNDGPVAVADTASTDEDTAVNFAVLGNDSDPDSSDALSVTGASITNDAQGSVVVNGDNTLNYDPGSAYNHLAVDESATVEITYQISDGHGGTSTATVSLAVSGVNDVAAITGDNAGAVTEDETLTATGTFTVGDPDTGESSIQPQTDAAGTYGTFTILASGEWTYSLNNDSSAVQSLGADDTVTDSFTVASSDGTATETVTITVHGANDNSAPQITLVDPPGGAITEPQGSQSAPLTETAASYLTHGNTLVNGLGSADIGSATFGENALALDDDNSSAVIPISSVFTGGLNFFGTTYTSLFVNNNGNLTFGSPNGIYTPSSITAGSTPIIAPFWADVETTNQTGLATTPGGNSTGSNHVFWDLDSTNHVFTVTWDDVSFYNDHNNPLNAFQLQLIDEGSGNFAMVFRYEDVNWTTGDASGGSNGLGGTPARAGYTAGDGNPDHYFELPGSGNQAQMLGLPDAPGNTGIPGVDVFHVVNGVVVPETLTDSGVIQFTDAETEDVHQVTGTYVGDGIALGALTVHLDLDTAETGTGQLTWTYSVASSTIDYLDEGETKVEQFEISIDDQHGGKVTQMISVTLNGTGDTPVVFAQFAAGEGPSPDFNNTALRGPSNALVGLVDFTALPHTELSNGPSPPSDHRLAFPSLASVLDLGGDTNSATIAEFTRSAHNDNPNPVHAATTSAPPFSAHDSSPHTDAAHNVSMSDVTASVSGGHEHAAHHPTA